MNNIPLSVKKYLNKYSAGNWKLTAAELKNITTAIVIPALGEFNNIKKLFESFLENDETYFHQTLLIVVVNNSADLIDVIIDDNQKLIKFIEAIINKDSHYVDDLVQKLIDSKLNFAFVDASSRNNVLPEKDAGVGLARKIGMDLALTVFDYSKKDKKILVCLDADCVVKNNYITEINKQFTERNISAAVINFEHYLEKDEKYHRAIICYEIFLRYYVLSLKLAGSKYAFHTIGSSMACDYQSYIKIQGMNKRPAAEDFYFLEKLAKIVNIEKINTTTVFPSSRSSWRVPFGTGQRVGRFILGEENEYLLYNPEIFKILKSWLGIFNSDEIHSGEDYLRIVKKIDIQLYNFLKLNKFEIYWNKILANSKSDEQIKKQKYIWFDGFRTLKFVHYLRDNGYPMINMFDALDELFYNYKVDKLPDRKGKEIPSLEIQKVYLEILKELERL